MPAADYRTPLAAALAAQAANLRLREETGADADFVVALYTDTRWEELRQAQWPEAAVREFLAQQSRLQSDHYRLHYPGAELLLIERAEAGTVTPIGRIYLRAGNEEVRLMDIALLASECGRGIGTALVVALQQEVARRGQRLTLHVEPNNPAQRLYARLGFARIENRGVYDFLGWPAAAALS
ncbi:GNAT family N-acetyltransferase [Tahibacter caeni]|uniref:GNAT family N-acetyltransferase n=1 Tax=Tahibacter caeni TaxID=1453545 RepID=UPI00214844D2|nr:GNAT family N-acetyltransferase [Tahibacter caeni]